MSAEELLNLMSVSHNSKEKNVFKHPSIEQEIHFVI